MITRGTVQVRSDIAAAVQLACLLEASATKPGNVSPGRSFADTRYDDFLASAAAVGPVFVEAGAQPVGRTIRLAVEATARWTHSNTNLGIVLLLAPLARAALDVAESTPLAHAESPDSRRRITIAARDLHDALELVLATTTVEDAADVYAAIRLAAPGGLGRSESQDVAAEPTLPLRAVMALAADRDDIAREYATGFGRTFAEAAPALRDGILAGLSWDDAVVETFLRLLAFRPDTHIRRRGGPEMALEVSRQAATALAAGGVRSDAGRRTILEMDRALRHPRNTGNPGTTADLTAAAIFVVLLDGTARAANDQQEDFDAATR